MKEPHRDRDREGEGVGTAIAFQKRPMYMKKTPYVIERALYICHEMERARTKESRVRVHNAVDREDGEGGEGGGSERETEILRICKKA